MTPRPEPRTVAGRIAGRDLPSKWRPEYDQRVAEAEMEAVAVVVDRLAAFEDWARRWIEAADARAGIHVAIGEMPPWHTLSTAKNLNDELRALLGQAGPPESRGE